MKKNEIAAAIHKRMCEDSRFGYSWEERWGYYYNEWTYDGRNYVVYAGDYDCSSSVITAWRKALEGTPFEGSLDSATYTGNMRSVFVKSGLFEWKPMSFIAAQGDIYLNESVHTAMCQSQVPDLMSEFCINENGEVYGGRRGDQTGWESAVNPFREEFDGILHYTGKADSAEPLKSWPLQMYQSNGTRAQKFAPIHREDGYVTLVCQADGRCVDAQGAVAKPGTPVQLYVRNDTKAQDWLFKRKDDPKYKPTEAAPYEIVSALDPNLVLDVKGASDADGAKVWLYTRNGTSAQEWYRLDNGDGTWTIMNNALGRKVCLDCVGGGK